MCGIAGWISSSVIRDERAVLSKMADSIAHRGPDDYGYYLGVTRRNSQVALAHRRLSIIDLSGGHQPMHDDEAGLVVVFNGEIYNFLQLRNELETAGHHFKTRSDTEILLKGYREWGDDFIGKLRGMFAFALWDGKAERLLIARDRFGKKPLFIYQREGNLIFSSEIKALLQFPGINARLDEHSIQNYLLYRYVPSPYTLFKDIKKLPPATFAVWQDGDFQQYKYYIPPDQNRYSSARIPDNPVPLFLEQLDEAVRIRMVSDVPFGAFLSGGIDSSAVVGLMSRHSSSVSTFSVGFHESGYSELSHARLVAQTFGAVHHELILSPDELIEYLPILIRYRDAPVSEPSDIPIYLLSQEARKHVKMVLTGEGSDEVLGGYPKHLYERMSYYYQILPKIMRSGLIEPLIARLPYKFRRIKTAISSIGIDDVRERYPRWFGALSQKDLNLLLLPQYENALSHVSDEPFNTSGGNSPLRSILYFDQTSWLPDNLLERGDRMTMAASLEARMPFMDHYLAEFISSLPDRFRVRNMTTKWILRTAMKNMLPEKILNRPKVGFRVPVNEWFQDSMKDYLREHLIGSQSITRGYFDIKVLNRFLAEHIQRRQNHEKILWTLLNLELWHREYLAT